MNDNEKEPASNFLLPSAWIRAAQTAHPAFKFAIVAGGLAALVATVSQFGASPATLVFGSIIVVVLMVLFLVFAQAARLRHHELSLAARILVWAFLCLSLGTALLLFTSTFFNAPLPFHDHIVRRLGLSVTTTDPISIPTPTTAPKPPPTQHPSSSTLTAIYTPDEIEWWRQQVGRSKQPDEWLQPLFILSKASFKNKVRFSFPGALKLVGVRLSGISYADQGGVVATFSDSAHTHTFFLESPKYAESLGYAKNSGPISVLRVDE